LPYSALHSQEIDTEYFDYWKYYKDGPDVLYKNLVHLGLDQLKERKAKINELETAADWQKRKSEVHKTLKRIIGDFPEKTPLNARITGKLERDDFSVEKIVFESVPNYYVTSVLLIPKKLNGKAPAVIYCSGHTEEGFRSETYQHIIINLVKKGFVVFAFDPVGQGERYQYLDESGMPKFGSTHEHSYAGTQCMISGYSPARYFIWDGIRAIDYLFTRPEVDTERIGITGRSGGGTQSSHIAAIDERIAASAPECYITSLEYILKTIGPQDAEQNFFGSLSEGIDHADLLVARAPKPTMVISTTRDFFSIQGARDTFREAKLAFDALGKPENFQMAEDDDVHKSTRKNREAMYAFFQKHLALPGDHLDLDVEVFDQKELQVSPTGQVLTSYNSETIFSLNQSYTKELVKAFQPKRRAENLDLGKMRQEIQKKSGYREPKSHQKLIFSGRYTENETIYEYYLLESSDNYMVPLLYAQPAKKIVSGALLIFSENGKADIVDSQSLAFKLLAKEIPVLLADLPGFGEMGPGYLKGDAYIHGVSHNQWYTGMLTGKSLCAVRAEEILQLVQAINSQLSIDKNQLTVMGSGPLGSEVLHAALFSENIRKIALVDPLISYSNLNSTKEYDSKWVLSSVPGMLRTYDLPDLIGCLSDRKVMILNPRDASGKLVNKKDEENELDFLTSGDFGSGYEIEYSIDDAESALLNWVLDIQ
jgi:cephalosporin-C deacetylase-like acetyl esterase